MHLSAVHFLLTYRCTQECPHCFHFGSPEANQVMTRSQAHRYIQQVARAKIPWIFFEGGEPTLYFPLLQESIELAKKHHLNTAVVTNGYWITSLRDTVPYLKAFRRSGLDLLQISCDTLHGNLRLEPLQDDIVHAAKKAGIACEFIGVSVPDPDEEPTEARRGAPITDGDVVFRGRAAHGLEQEQATWLWSSFDECPHEDLADPYRIHIDMYGQVQVCQGISIGNMERDSLTDILSAYDPIRHAITGPLIQGGPAELVRRYQVPHAQGAVDACHLCYAARRRLRERFPDELAPAWAYGGRPKQGRSRGKSGGRNASTTDRKNGQS